MAVTPETNLPYIDKLFRRLSDLRSVSGLAIYELFQKIVSDFWQVSPPLRTEMFLQLIIATANPLK